MSKLDCLGDIIEEYRQKYANYLNFPIEKVLMVHEIRDNIEQSITPIQTEQDYKSTTLVPQIRTEQIYKPCNQRRKGQMVHEIRDNIEQSITPIQTEQDYKSTTLVPQIRTEQIYKLQPGHKGQMLVDSIINRLNKYSIVNVSATNHNGDLRLNDIIMIECKHYSRTVNQGEVDKFYNDIDVRNVHGAIFISTSPIVV